MNPPLGPLVPASAVEAVSGRSRADTDLERKIRELRRMRMFATSLLVVMALVFVASSLGMGARPWLAYVRAFAEAAMVGACADWFAVVALFRRPFGLPIPHTGIIPRNKVRIGAALGRFMSNNFLSPLVLARKLDKIDAAGFVSDWLDRPGNARRVAGQASLSLPRVLAALPREPLIDWLALGATRGLGAVPAAPLASKLLELLWARGETQALLERAIEFAEDSLLRNRDFIRAEVAKKSSRFIPKWVDAMLADRVISGIQSTLGEMRKPDHPWRAEIERAISKLIADLAGDPQMRARGEALKRDALSNPVFAARMREACDSLESQAHLGLSAHAGTVAAGLEFALVSLSRWLREDEAIRAKLNRWGRRMALRAILPRREEIGVYIASVVENWDAATFVDRLELQVGRDLQYIRINGTLVGGLAGLLIFIASKWIPAL